MLDENEAKLSRIGEVIITKSGIYANGFDAKGGTCRDVAALASAWAIGELQKELVKTLEAPGKSNICVG